MTDERSGYILVVDDERDMEPLFVQNFRKEIKAGRLCFRFAFSAAEALQHLELHGPASFLMILSDVNMPGMSGLELLEIVNARYPGMKIVMITAYGTPDMMDKVSRLGAQGLVPKPVDFSELRARILGN